jgi:hypothetical protein
LPSLNPSAVISAGAANLQNLASDAEMLQTLRGIYASALRDVFIYALAAACVAFVFTFGMEWLNLKNAIKSEEGTKATGKFFNTTDGGAFRSLHSRAEEGSLKGMTTSTTLSLSPVSMDTPCEVKSLGWYILGESNPNFQNLWNTSAVSLVPLLESISEISV